LDEFFSPCNWTRKMSFIININDIYIYQSFCLLKLTRFSDDTYALVGIRSYEKRRALLQETYDFFCNCIACSSKSWKLVEKMASVRINLWMGFVKCNMMQISRHWLVLNVPARLKCKIRKKHARYKNMKSQLWNASSASSCTTLKKM